MFKFFDQEYKKYIDSFNLKRDITFYEPIHFLECDYDFNPPPRIRISLEQFKKHTAHARKQMEKHE
jgi:hypothetical protein